MKKKKEKPKAKSKDKEKKFKNKEKKKKKARKVKETIPTIREMALEDLPAVYALGERLFTADWPTLYRTWDEYELVELFASDGDFCMVAELQKKIVGFVLGTLIFKRHSAWSYGYLLWLGVAPEVRGHGLGERLVNRIMEEFIAHGGRMMLVDTSIENQPALRLFRRMGFGDETQHVYFFKNLTSHPQYLRRKNGWRGGQAKTPPMLSNIASSGSKAVNPEK